MRFVFYTHSAVSDWNHGNAHFLRGVMRALQARGHRTLAVEPASGWSRENLLRDRGPAALAAFADAFPDLAVQTYDAGFDHEAVLDGADVVIVHEWTDPALIARIGAVRRGGGRFRLLFHDTHHRAVSAGDQFAAIDLDGYDAVLAFGASLRDRYRSAGWGRSVHVWHEAADTTVFRPHPDRPRTADLVWIGNWGDGERAAELDTFLLSPVEALGLSASVYGVRYPAEARDRLARSGIAYGGWLANAQVPQVFARHRVTVHVPRAPYRRLLPGIPTIRPFEALACGIPLVTAPWEDSEGLFRPGDMRRAADGTQMRAHLRELLSDPAAAAEQALSGRETILARHTCGHRADELLAILSQIDGTAVQGAGGADGGAAPGADGAAPDGAGRSRAGRGRANGGGGADPDGAAPRNGGAGSGRRAQGGDGVSGRDGGGAISVAPPRQHPAAADRPPDPDAPFRGPATHGPAAATPGDRDRAPAATPPPYRRPGTGTADDRRRPQPQSRPAGGRP